MTRIFKLTAWGDISTAVELSPEQALVEVIATVEDGQQSTAGAAIGSLAELLRPMVDVQKA